MIIRRLMRASKSHQRENEGPQRKKKMMIMYNNNDSCNRSSTVWLTTTTTTAADHRGLWSSRCCHNNKSFIHNFNSAHPGLLSGKLLLQLLPFHSLVLLVCLVCSYQLAAHTFQSGLGICLLVCARSLPLTYQARNHLLKTTTQILHLVLLELYH